MMEIPSRTGKGLLVKAIPMLFVSSRIIYDKTRTHHSATHKLNYRHAEYIFGHCPVI